MNETKTTSSYRPVTRVIPAIIHGIGRFATRAPGWFAAIVISINVVVAAVALSWGPDGVASLTQATRQSSQDITDATRESTVRISAGLDDLRSALLEQSEHSAAQRATLGEQLAQLTLHIQRVATQIDRLAARVEKLEGADDGDQE